jgi:hypothetical protein
MASLCCFVNSFLGEFFVHGAVSFLFKIVSLGHDVKKMGTVLTKVPRKEI